MDNLNTKFKTILGEWQTDMATLAKESSSIFDIRVNGNPVMTELSREDLASIGAVALAAMTCSLTDDVRLSNNDVIGVHSNYI